MIKLINKVMIPVISVLTLILIVPVLFFMVFTVFHCDTIITFLRVIGCAVLICVCIHINKSL